MTDSPTTDLESVRQTVLEAVEEFNSGQLDDERIDPRQEAVLVGEGGQLDSMGLVTLIVAVEQKVLERFGATVTLADARAFSQKSSPFRTLESLTAALAERLSEAQGNHDG